MVDAEPAVMPLVLDGEWLLIVGVVFGFGGEDGTVAAVVALDAKAFLAGVGGCRAGPKGTAGSRRLSRVGRGLNRGIAIP